MLPVTTRPRGPQPQVAAITTLASRQEAVLVRPAVTEIATRPTSARRRQATPVNWAAIQRRHQRQRALLLALLVAATLAAIAVLGFATAHTGISLQALLLPGAVVLAIALWMRRPRRCPGVVVHCPPTHHRH